MGGRGWRGWDRVSTRVPLARGRAVGRRIQGDDNDGDPGRVWCRVRFTKRVYWSSPLSHKKDTGFEQITRGS